MSAEPINPEQQPSIYYGEFGPPLVRRPGEGILNGVAYAASQRAELASDESTPKELTPEEIDEHNEEQRRILLHEFYDYCKQVHDIDPRSPSMRDIHDLSLVVHSFVWGKVDSAQKLEEARGALDSSYQVTQIKTLPYDQIMGRINTFFERSSAGAKFQSDQEKREQETFLHSAKQRAYAYIADGKTTEEITPFLDEPSGLQAGRPRYAVFPEMRYTMELREALIADKAWVAAKSAEITFAAYGSWFPATIRNGIKRVTDRPTSSLIRRLGSHELPVGEAPDKPMKPRRKD